VVITSRYYESSGEIMWQVTPQTRAFRWSKEDWEEVVWVCCEARADAADFLLTDVSGRSRRMSVLGTYRGASTGLDWQTGLLYLQESCIASKLVITQDFQEFVLA
jgi:hypothetical protein